jgi:tRNA (guanine-N7-)-methyltransferase
MIEIDLNAVAVPFDWRELFSRPAPVDLEIGSGKGAFLLDLAQQQPDRNYLAVERAAKYHKLTCDRTARRGIENVRLIRTTAEDLFSRLITPASISRLFVLFPDPWPKKRHHKRRLFTPSHVTAMARILVPDGELFVKTDHADYAEVISSSLASCPYFTAIDPSSAFAQLPTSGFERKYLVEGRQVYPFVMKRATS